MNVKSKEPCVSKIEVESRNDNKTIFYEISTESGLIEELTLNDIIFIRDRLTGYINERKGKKGGKS